MNEIYLFLKKQTREFGCKNTGKVFAKYRGITGHWVDPVELGIGIEFSSEPGIIYSIRASAIDSIAMSENDPFVPFSIDLLPEYSQ